MNYCNTCNRGTRHPEAIPHRRAAVCAECGTENEIPYVPLFVITGAGGCGKTTVTDLLLRKPNSYFVVEADYLGHGKGGFDTWEQYWNGVAIVCRTLGRNRRPLVLSGWVAPSLMETFHSTQFFLPVHYLVLACDPATQRKRLEIRPSITEDRIEAAIGATRSMLAEVDERENATALDTSDMTPDEVAVAVDRWILERLVT